MPLHRGSSAKFMRGGKTVSVGTEFSRGSSPGRENKVLVMGLYSVGMINYG